VKQDDSAGQHFIAQWLSLFPVPFVDLVLTGANLVTHFSGKRRSITTIAIAPGAARAYAEGVSSPDREAPACVPGFSFFGYFLSPILEACDVIISLVGDRHHG